MLTLLQIENVAVVARADITFRPGFNVLTGETGAGKSIIIDSVAALTGERTSKDLVRTGADFASVSGLFDGADALSPLLEEAGIAPESDGTVCISRRISADGRNVCRVNGRAAPLSLLRELGARLIRSHGQHDSRGLLDPDTHISMLDAYAGTDGLLSQYRELLAGLKDIRARQKALARDEDEKARRVEVLRFQTEEIEAAALEPGEDEALAEKRRAARGAQAIIKACAGAAEALSGGEARGAEECVEDAAGRLLSVKDPPAELADIARRLGELTYELSDISDRIKRLSEETGFSAASLDEIEERLSLINLLKRKYGGSAESVAAYARAAKAELEGILRSDEELERLSAEYAGCYEKTMAAASALSVRRKEAAARLEKAVENELSYLCMAGARFEVRFAARERDGRTVFGSDGIDTAEFYISANRGEDPRPLAKTASGGELSRIMLAMNTVLAPEGAPTVIYDEVDAGISGIAASRVADRLAKSARGRQVLCVTHLSQMAACADAHFLIKKSQDGGRTFTSVCELDLPGRIDELARINGGENPSESMKRAAAEQIEKARA